jgi:hypothetical protein
MTTLNQFNSINQQLTNYGSYTGKIVICNVEDSITVNILSTGNVSVVVRQYATNQNIPALYNSEQSYSVSPNVRQTIQTPINSPWFNVIVNNLDDASVNIELNTYLSLSSNNVIVQQLELLNENITSGGVTNNVNIVSQTADLATETTLSALSGKVTACDTTNVTITGSLPSGNHLIGTVLVLATNPDNQGFPLLMDATQNLLVSDTVSQGSLNSIYLTTTFMQENTTDIVTYTSETSINTLNINNKITKCDTDNVAISSGSIDVYGRQSNFNFFPTPENNTVQIYADESKGTNVVGGWQYINSGTGGQKINWYIYQASNPTGNPTTAGQTVASASSIYAVVNQASISTPAYPFVIIYTRADSGTNASVFKSRLVFQNTTTATTGMKLLYTGSDPVDIHPEITGVNRVNLPFVLGASTKSLEAAAGEEILSASLQTDSGYTAGRYNFVMQQFGIQWVDTPFILPIQNGKVQVNTGVIISTESSPTGAVTNSLGNTGVVVSGVHSTLQSLTIANVGGTVFGYVKVYNKATAPTASDTPVMTLPLNHDSVQQVECHSLDFPLGIGIRASLGFPAGNTTAPDGTCYATAFYTNIL